MAKRHTVGLAVCSFASFGCYPRYLKGKFSTSELNMALFWRKSLNGLKNYCVKYQKIYIKRSHRPSDEDDGKFCNDNSGYMNKISSSSPTTLEEYIDISFITRRRHHGIAVCNYANYGCYPKHLQTIFNEPALKKSILWKMTSIRLFKYCLKYQNIYIEHFHRPGGNKDGNFCDSDSEYKKETDFELNLEESVDIIDVVNFRKIEKGKVHCLNNVSIFINITIFLLELRDADNKNKSKLKKRWRG